jgi:hypothetical protein
MTEADKPAFLQAIARLALALREPEPDVVQIRVYFDALKDREIELIVAAADRLVASAPWFPKASEWGQLARQIECERTEAQRMASETTGAPMLGLFGYRLAPRREQPGRTLSVREAATTRGPRARPDATTGGPRGTMMNAALHFSIAISERYTSAEILWRCVSRRACRVSGPAEELPQ